MGLSSYRNILNGSENRLHRTRATYDNVIIFTQSLGESLPVPGGCHQKWQANVEAMSEKESPPILGRGVEPITEIPGGRHVTTTTNNKRNFEWSRL